MEWCPKRSCRCHWSWWEKFIKQLSKCQCRIVFWKHTNNWFLDCTGFHHAWYVNGSKHGNSERRKWRWGRFTSTWWKFTEWTNWKYTVKISKYSIRKRYFNLIYSIWAGDNKQGSRLERGDLQVTAWIGGNGSYWNLWWTRTRWRFREGDFFVQKS